MLMWRLFNFFADKNCLGADNDIHGSCLYGCVQGRYGAKCEKECPDDCLVCHPYLGFCLHYDCNDTVCNTTHFTNTSCTQGKYGNECRKTPLMFWAWISIRVRCTTLCNKVCQWLATDLWFSPGFPVSSTNKTDCHDITEILLKMALNTIKQTMGTNVGKRAWQAVKDLPLLMIMCVKNSPGLV
jgi:hypothetical protein